MDTNLLIQIVQELRLGSTPPLVVQSDSANNITYVIYKLQTIDVYNGYPILRVISTTGSGYTTDVIERGFLISSGSFDVLIFNAALTTAIGGVSFG